MGAFEHNTDLSNDDEPTHTTTSKTLKNVNGSVDEAWKLTHKTHMQFAYSAMIIMYFYRFMTILELFSFFHHQFLRVLRFWLNKIEQMKKMPDKYFSWLCCLRTWRNVLWCPNKILPFFFQIKSVLHRFLLRVKHWSTI